VARRSAAARSRFVADAIADIIARRRAIIEPARLMIARAAWRATLVAPRSAILSASGLTLARWPVFVGDRIAEAIGLDPRLGAVRISWTARIGARPAVTLTLAASASAGARRTETARPRATGATARSAAGRPTTLVSARRTAVERCLLSGKPGRLVDANLLLRRAAT
jgi:hypothetical protein